MSLRSAAVIPAAPLLVPELAGGSHTADDRLRYAVDEAVGGLGQDVAVVIVGEGPTAGAVEGNWDWSGFGVQRRAGSGPTLPFPLALGSWWLDRVGHRGDRRYVSVPAQTSARQCRRIGEVLVEHRDVALLAVGDGTARRSEQAPGYLDDRAEAYDEQAASALASGDPSSLLALDAALGLALLASGRPCWQVLAGAAGGRRWRAELRHTSAPYGVCYLVAVWTTASLALSSEG